MHVLLIHNRASGTADVVDPAAVLADHGCEVTDTDVPTAIQWCARVPGALSDIERVVVAGGDGSIGCAAALAIKLDVPLAVVPAGTANDFARAMGLPEELAHACALAATGSELRDVDLGRVDGTPFLNVASVGLAPDAAERARPLKRGIGAFAYPVGALLAAIRSRPVSLVARVDGEPAWSGRTWQTMVASTGAFGGGADIGSTRDGDGMLDLVIIPASRGTRELASDAAALRRGELAQREGVIHVRGREIELTLHRAPRMVVDGEVLEVHDRHVSCSVDERPVRVVVG